MQFIKNILFWTAFWLFYVFAFVVGLAVIVVFYIIASPIAIYELLNHFIKNRNEHD